jgi:hypothetical protein
VRIDKANPKSVELLPLNQHHDLLIAGNGGLGQIAEGLKHSPALAKAAEGKLTCDKGMRQYAPRPEEICQRGIAALQVVDPHRGIDDDH